ncbi:unnamed protein product [Scytosiphon promiscuus]
MPQERRSSPTGVDNTPRLYTGVEHFNGSSDWLTANNRGEAVPQRSEAIREFCRDVCCLTQHDSLPSRCVPTVLRTLRVASEWRYWRCRRDGRWAGSTGNLRMNEQIRRR